MTEQPTEWVTRQAQQATRTTAHPSMRTRRTAPGTGTRPVTPYAKPVLSRLDDITPQGPSVVALGGGHGLAMVLSALRLYAGSITAVVSVADDGGSSGRLRESLGIPAPGDLRKCLVALADDSTPWKKAFAHRFNEGELEGHALGNLVIAGLADAFDDFERAIEEAGRLLQAAGRVYPATSDSVVLRAEIDGKLVEGQVAVANTAGSISRVELLPADPVACFGAVGAIELADQIVLAPGSLFTSLLPALVVPGIRTAIAGARGKVVQVCNLNPQKPETDGLDGTDHLRAVLAHDVRVDTFVYQADGALAVDDLAVFEMGIDLVAADLASAGGRAHDSARLAATLKALL